jgi:hypothetical protein
MTPIIVALHFSPAADNFLPPSSPRRARCVLALI